MIKLDILSDPVCPWCMIGKARLDRALEQRDGHPFTIEWHPFELNPDMPKGGMPRPEYLETKFGGKAQAAKVYAAIDAAAKDTGIEIDWPSIKRMPNTMDAHRLIHWAGLEQKQTPVVDGLMRAYWIEGRDIGAAEVLADVADSAGLDAAMVQRLLATDADIADIEAREAHSRERGVTSVPTFIIANQHVVPGAQPTDLWLKLIDEILEQI